MNKHIAPFTTFTAMCLSALTLTACTPDIKSLPIPNIDDTPSSASTPATQTAVQDGPFSKPMTKEEGFKALSTLEVKKTDGNLYKTYNRDNWHHWNKVQGCWDVRDEMLYRDAVPGTQVFQKNGTYATKGLKSSCGLTSGQWNEPYTGTVMTNPADLQIDHIVPLRAAHLRGGADWTVAQKSKFANDPEVLAAVDSFSNESKGDKGPGQVRGQWAPKNQAVWCGYATKWVQISTKYGLFLTPPDHDGLVEMFNTCQ